jgi:hypothetical protein
MKGVDARIWNTYAEVVKGGHPALLSFGLAHS